MRPEGRPVTRAENYEKFDPTTLRWSTAEEVTESLARINLAVLSREITPNEAKSTAAVAAVALKAIGLSVREEMDALKEQFKQREQEQRGPGRRKGI